ncbi:MAG TPA: trypsin-like peptidase domain-containing protein [Pirellulales bacterium]|nr:trypsin-like peptidase domain-containing protein [Pirellulales bacterium]
MHTPADHDVIETLIRAIPLALKRVLAETKKTAQATAAHGARLAGLGKARWHARMLERNAFDSNVDLGRRMAELGIGDAEQRARIARHHDSIRNLQVAGARASRSAVQLEAEEAKLAQIELQRGAPPAGAEVEYVAAVSARDAVLAQQVRVALLRAAVRPDNWAHALRLLAGYVIVCLLLAVLIVARTPERGAAPNRNGAPIAVTDATPSTTIETQDALPATLTTEQVVAQSEPSVAFIKGRRSSGTGFMVRPGVVATNKHVIESEFIDQIKVHFPSADANTRGPFSAELQYEDPERDLAFLSLSSSLPPLEMAPQHAFRRGQEVIVIGNPGVGDELILQNAISRGVMSTQAMIKGQQYYQLGISVNPGNSGGPVLDASGLVVGVITLRASNQEGLGFCIPLPDLNVAVARLDSLSIPEIASIRSDHQMRVERTAGGEIGNIAEGKWARSASKYPRVPESAKNAMNAVTKVAAKTEVGINYKDYSTAVGEAWAEVKIFAESPDGEAVPEFSYLLISAMDKHRLALDVWRGQFHDGPTSYDEDLSTLVLKECWRAAQCRIETARSLIRKDDVESGVSRVAVLHQADESYETTVRSLLILLSAANAVILDQSLYLLYDCVHILVKLLVTSVLPVHE